jgi:hypothetical protein
MYSPSLKYSRTMEKYELAIKSEGLIVKSRPIP